MFDGCFANSGSTTLQTRAPDAWARRDERHRRVPPARAGAPPPRRRGRDRARGGRVPRPERPHPRRRAAAVERRQGDLLHVRLNPESGYPHVLSEFGVRFHDARECARVPGHVVDAHAAAALEPWSAADAPGLARALAGVPSDVPSLIAHARGERTSSETGGGTRDSSMTARDIEDVRGAVAGRVPRPVRSRDAVRRPRGDRSPRRRRVRGHGKRARRGPAEAYRRLAQDPASFPPCLRDAQLADPDVPTHCVLVHDASFRRRCRKPTWRRCEQRRKRSDLRAAGPSCCP